MIKNSKYFKILNKPKNKKLRLYCFPYAGGSASIYNSFIENIGEEIELVAIALPGRAEMMFDEPIKDMQELVDILYQQMRSNLHEPFAFFGHSMGGSISFALAQKIEQLSSASPKFIVISATRPQNLQNLNSKHTLSDDGLIDVLRQNSASPKEVLDSKEMMELILPGVRADYQLIETYKVRKSSALSSQLVIFNDETDIKKEDILSWQEFFKTEAKYVSFEGGHFFIHSKVDKITQEIKDLIN